MTNEADGLAVVLADLIRPIIGIDCRSGEEAHAIMCDRIKHKFAALSTPAARMLAGEGEAVDDVMIGNFIAQYDEGAAGCMMDADDAQALAREFKRMQGLIYCPGVLRCAKCDFRLIKTKLTPAGAFANEEPDSCPNCNVPMWRVTWKDEANDAYKTAESQMDRALEAERRLAHPPAAEPVGVREAAKDALTKADRLIDDMSRFVGQMALRDYALLNETPIAISKALTLLALATPARTNDARVAIRDVAQCERPPEGWVCRRDRGHDGPCAAHRPARWDGVVELVDQITDEEGATVTFTGQNPDFNGLPNEAVVIQRGPDWREETLRADTLADCLRAALQKGPSQ